MLLRLKKVSASQHHTNHPLHPATCSVKAEHAGGKCHLVTLSRSLTALHTVRTGTRCSLPRHPHRLHKQTGASQSLSTQGYPRIWNASWGFLFFFFHSSICWEEGTFKAYFLRKKSGLKYSKLQTSDF